MRDDDAPSGIVLTTLALAWAGLLASSILVVIDLWPRETPALLVSGAGAGLAAALGEAMRQAAPQFFVVGVTVLGAPLFLFTWLALPPRDRWTFPAVVDLWVFVALAAFSDWLPSGEKAAFTLVCAVGLLVAEMVRTLFTAMVRHGTRPAGVREASV